MVHDSSDILKILVDTGQTVRAGRVIGAFRNIGRTDIADEIAGTMKRMGYTINEEDPFEKVMEIHVSQSPYAVRLRLMWQHMREDVIANFTRLKSNLSAKEFLERMETRYKLDAYHSLSIEGYRVTDELINKVKSGAWKPDGEDMDSKNALAARGYWQAFREVKRAYLIFLKVATVRMWRNGIYRYGTAKCSCLALRQALSNHPILSVIVPIRSIFAIRCTPL